MCDYCNNDSIEKLLKKPILEDYYIGLDKKMLATELNYEPLYLLLDIRCNTGYLRITSDDYGCLDHGEKIKIKYCPMCGREL